MPGEEGQGYKTGGAILSQGMENLLSVTRMCSVFFVIAVAVFVVVVCLYPKRKE